MNYPWTWPCYRLNIERSIMPCPFCEGPVDIEYPNYDRKNLQRRCLSCGKKICMEKQLDDLSQLIEGINDEQERELGRLPHVPGNTGKSEGIG